MAASNVPSSAMLAAAAADEASSAWQSSAAREKRKGRAKDEDEATAAAGGPSSRGRNAPGAQRKRLASGPFKFYRPMIDEHSGVYATSAPPRNSFLTITDNVDLQRVATGDLASTVTVTPPKKRHSQPFEQQQPQPQPSHASEAIPSPPPRHTLQHDVRLRASSPAHLRGARHVRAAQLMMHSPSSMPSVPAYARSAFVPVVRHHRPRAVHATAATVPQPYVQQSTRPLLPPLWNVASGIYFPQVDPMMTQYVPTVSTLPPLVYISPSAPSVPHHPLHHPLHQQQLQQQSPYPPLRAPSAVPPTRHSTFP